jgi:hypothetical protein
LKARRKKTQSNALDVVLEGDELREFQEWLTEQANIEVQKGTAKGLSVEATRLALTMVQPMTGSHVRDWCRIAMVDHKVYYRNKDDQRFKDLLDAFRKRRSAERLARADRMVDRLIDFGEVKAIRLLYEVEGLLIHRVESKDVTETHEERMKRLKEKARESKGQG